LVPTAVPANPGILTKKEKKRIAKNKRKAGSSPLNPSNNRYTLLGDIEDVPVAPKKFKADEQASVLAEASMSHRFSFPRTTINIFLF
jgi:hypothetical protein